MGGSDVVVNEQDIPVVLYANKIAVSGTASEFGDTGRTRVIPNWRDIDFCCKIVD